MTPTFIFGHGTRKTFLVSTIGLPRLGSSGNIHLALSKQLIKVGFATLDRVSTYAEAIWENTDIFNASRLSTVESSGNKTLKNRRAFDRDFLFLAFS